jgi:hypothetical protein
MTRHTYFGMLFFSILFSSAIHTQEKQAQENLARKIGKGFFEGILQSNYREIPLDEILPISRLSLPRPRCSQTPRHPVLLFRKETEGDIRLRSRYSPYQEWAENIINAANRLNRDPASVLITETDRSAIAKLNAFAYFLTADPFYREEAIEALRHIRDPDPVHSLEGGRKDIGWGDWMQAADALRQYAVAYDLLYEYLSAEEREKIEACLTKQAGQMAAHLHWVPKNNHAIAIASGIGTVALTVRHRFSQRWLDAAIDQFESSLSKIESDGSYREGVYYGRFVASRFYPFVIYLKNATGMNLLDHPRLRRFNRWLIDMEKPDGTAPDFDDAFPENWFYAPLAVGLLPESGELRYRFESSSDRYDPKDPDWIEAFCAFDDGVVSVLPDYGPAVFYPDGGMAVFRGEKEIYGLLLGEPGRSYLSGHDHAEPTAFTLSAFGRDWLVDAGYGPGGVENPDRAYFVSGEAHNIPLVNGLGPDENPVWGDELGGEMIRCFKTEWISSATVSARYRMSDVKRTLWFVGQRYFIVLDNLSSEIPQRFSIPWHGLGTLRFVDASRVRWETEDASLEAEFLNPECQPVTIVPQAGLHTQDLQNGRHTSATVHLPLSQEQKLVTLFLPQEKDGREYTLAPEPVLCDGLATGRRIVPSDADWEDVLVLADCPWQSGPFESDGRIGLYRKSEIGEIPFFTVAGASYVRIGGETIFESNCLLNITLILDDLGWYGHLSQSEEDNNNLSSLRNESKTAVLEFYPHMDPGCVLLDKKNVSYNWQDQKLVLQLERDGIFEMGPQSSRAETAEFVRENLPMLQRLSQLPDPSIAIRNMSRADITQLNNEIIQESGRAGLQYSDSLLGSSQKTAAIYGVVSGLLNSFYRQTGEAQFTIPQRMDIEHRLFQKEVSYFEEGYIDKSGLNARRHQIGVDQTFWMSHENLFDNHRMTRIHFNREPFGLETYIEDWEEDQAYYIGVHRRDQNGWFSASHSERMKNLGRTSVFSLGHKDWSGNVTFGNENESGHYFSQIQGKRQTEKWTSIVDIQTLEGEGLAEFRLQNSWRFSPNFMGQADLEERRDFTNSFWQSQFSSLLCFDIHRVNGTIWARRNWEGEILGTWQGAFRRGRWRLDSRGQFGTLFRGDFGIAHRSDRFSWQTRFSRGKENLIDLVWHPSPVWMTTFRIEQFLSPLKVHEKAVGLYYRKSRQIGGEIRFLNDERKQKIGFTGVAGLQLWGDESLYLYTTVFFKGGGQLDRLEIQVTQSGMMVTPGLLIVHDRRALVRFEGYLMWRF